MKSSHRYVALLATASMVLAGTAQAGDKPYSAGKSELGTGEIARVTKDSVKGRFTAKDLIGAAVYDPAGDKIGDIADIDLHGSVPAPLASSFNMRQAGDRSIDRTMPAGSATPGAGTTDALRDSSRPISDAISSMAHATVFVSVGGLWGVGDDLVSVPVSKLSYNAGKDRFELQSAKADIVALAEGDRRGGYTAATRPGDVPMGTAAGKQAFADEATRVQSALKADPQTSAFAHNVTVTAKDGETLEIHGMVENKEQEKRILEAARRSTALKINDEIQVRD